MSALPFPYTSPTPHQSQLQQRVRLSLTSLRAIATTVAGTAPIRGGGKSSWYINVPPSSSALIDFDVQQALKDYINANVNYKFNGQDSANYSINSLTVLSQVSGANTTTFTAGLSYSTLKTTPSPTLNIVDLIAPTAIPGVVNANVGSATLVPSNPAVIPPNPDFLVAEVACVTPASCNAFIYGIILDLMLQR